ncbi:MAG TPA: zf-HC2 domain-containing protein [Terriglobia bacterium]|nr:zf-HC2 domain-containing protein [Terriglobia bacterium]
MSCLDFEKLIALDIEGDLPEPKSAKLGAHLRACGDCREFKGKLLVSQTLLKSLAQESVEEAVLAEVRERVLEGIVAEAKPARFLAWRFALAAALVTAAIVAAVTLWRPRAPSHVARASRPPSVERVAVGTTQRGQDARVTAGETPALGYPKIPTAKSKSELRQRKPSGSTLAARLKPPEELVVKLLTDDPNVVIYWVVD